jgi:hypothetical protein
MTKLLEIILALAEQNESSARLSDAQQAEVRRRIAAPDAFVTDQEILAFFRRLAGQSSVQSFGLLIFEYS